LRTKVFTRKEVQKNDTEIMKIRQNKWDDEREVGEEENKKFQYMLFDLLNWSDVQNTVTEHTGTRGYIRQDTRLVTELALARQTKVIGDNCVEVCYKVPHKSDLGRAKSLIPMN
jgi:hypothetical protein